MTRVPDPLVWKIAREAATPEAARAALERVDACLAGIEAALPALPTEPAPPVEEPEPVAWDPLDTRACGVCGAPGDPSRVASPRHVWLCRRHWWDADTRRPPRPAPTPALSPADAARLVDRWHHLNAHAPDWRYADRCSWCRIEQRREAA